MPTHSTHLHAVRDNLVLAERQAHRTVAFAALDDFAERRLRHQWTHPRLGRLLGASGPFVSLLGNYLEYRRGQRQVDVRKGIRPHGSSCAQLFLYDRTMMPLDLVNLGTSGDRTEQLASLLMQAIMRKVLVEPDTAQNIERMLGRACGMSWETIASTAQRQRAAQHELATSTTAMGRAA